MNILILGSGGREHTFAWKLAQSPEVGQLFVAPGNAGTLQFATNVDLSVNDFDTIKALVLEKQIGLVVVGPEDPLVKGIYDFFVQDPDLGKVVVIGPCKAAAQLEGSKDFAKNFMKAHHIPTAPYATFTKNTLEAGYQFLETLAPPYVLKADGLASGKGVLILNSLEEARSELKEMLVHAKFGQASTKVVIEAFLSGIELSCFVLTDGLSYKTLPTAKDYKRIGDGDTGLNTGGMGAVSPVPFADPEFMTKVEDKIIKPTLQGLQKEQIPYTGFLFIGLIKVKNEPYVIEYNIRMGDPETQVVLPRLKNDLVALFKAVGNQTLGQEQLIIEEKSATTVVLASAGYPGPYKKGKPISGFSNTNDTLVFHAGTVKKDDDILTNGGRVLSVTSFGNNFKEASKKSYEAIANISFEGMIFRKDIGFDL